jgi:hypothetical protein
MRSINTLYFRQNNSLILKLKNGQQKYTHRYKKRLIMISLINDLEIIFVLIFLYYS